MLFPPSAELLAVSPPQRPTMPCGGLRSAPSASGGGSGDGGGDGPPLAPIPACSHEMLAALQPPPRPDDRAAIELALLTGGMITMPPVAFTQFDVRNVNSSLEPNWLRDQNSWYQDRAEMHTGPRSPNILK